jgi:TetR/AcrR family transcriptional regulator, cholesterol catabolism regulator
MKSTRELLLQQATYLFATRGYDATSVQDVVDVADATKGAFYYHFESKDDLLYQIHEKFISYELEHAEEILQRGLPPREALRSLIINLVESIVLFQPEVTVFFRDMHRLSPGKFESIKKERDRYESYFGRVIEQGQEADEFRTDVSAKIQTLALFGMCNWMYKWYRSGGRESPRQIGKDLASLLLSGIEVHAGSEHVRLRSLPSLDGDTSTNAYEQESPGDLTRDPGLNKGTSHDH